MCRCSLENVTIDDRELTVDKGDSGITNQVSKSNKVSILHYVKATRKIHQFRIHFDLAEEDLLHPIHLPGGVGQGSAGDSDRLHHRDELLPPVLPRPRGVTGWESLERGETC